jgi:hypothetical protein
MTNTQAAPSAQGATSDRWIADIPKNSRETLRIQLSTFKGYDLINIRIWFRSNDGDELKPGKNGFAVRVEKLPELRDAIDKAIAAARAEGSLP